jgi:hypothetical protein
MIHACLTSGDCTAVILQRELSTHVIPAGCGPLVGVDIILGLACRQEQVVGVHAHMCQLGWDRRHLNNGVGQHMQGVAVYASGLSFKPTIDMQLTVRVKCAVKPESREAWYGLRLMSCNCNSDFKLSKSSFSHSPPQVSSSAHPS